MTLMNRHPRSLRFAFILIAFLLVPFQITEAAKKRHENNARAKKTSRVAARSERGRKLSAKERRSNKRERLSAKDSRRWQVSFVA
jgi:hypothetical protein